MDDKQRCECVEAATDLLDTHNIFNGMEATECIRVCGAAGETSDAELAAFRQQLVDRIRDAYARLEHLNHCASSSSSSASVNVNEDLPFIHSMCVRVLNECVYLLDNVGVWCLAKSLVPLISHLDKLASFMETSIRKEEASSSSGSGASSSSLASPVTTTTTSTSRGGVVAHMLNKASVQQELIIEFTATCLRQLRELCIKKLLSFKGQRSHTVVFHHRCFLQIIPTYFE